MDYLHLTKLQVRPVTRNSVSFLVAVFVVVVAVAVAAAAAAVAAVGVGVGVAVAVVAGYLLLHQD